MLGSLDYRVIRKVQHIIWNPGNQPYQTLKKALIKLYKISDDNRFDCLLHQTDLGDRKPSELLSELRTLLGESCSDNADLNKLLHKLFLDKLPPQVRLVLAGSPQPTLERTAQRVDDIMATISSAPSLNSNAAQLLHNQMFERHLDQLTDALEASLNFRKNNDYGSANRDQQFSRPPQFRESKRSFSSVSNLYPRREMPPNTPQDSCFPARSTTRTDSENLCFFYARFGAKALKCRAPCSWQPRNPRNFDNNINYRVASYSCRSQKKFLPTRQSLFYNPCSNMRFLLDTGAEISMIPPCRYYKPYYCSQDMIAANGTLIRIFGTRKLNINVVARHTFRWNFMVVDVAMPIIEIDFMRHFGLGIDVVNNTFILPKTSMYRRHHVHCVSCPNANDAVKLPFTSADTTDLTDTFPLEPCTALDTVNVDAANAVAPFINDFPKNAVDLPIVNDDDVSSALQEPKDPPIKREHRSPSLASEQPFDLLKADFLKHKVFAHHKSNFANTLKPKTITPGVLHSIITKGPPVKTRVCRLSLEQLTATSLRTRSAQKTYESNALFLASHVFICKDGQCSPLQRPYRGPFEVKDRSVKYFFNRHQRQTRHRLH